MASSYFNEENTVDYSNSELDSFPYEALKERENSLISLQLENNVISIIPRTIGQFSALVSLNLSDNGISYLSDEVTKLINLKTFIAKNNLLNCETFPQHFGKLENLEFVNVSGNNFTELPNQLLELINLKRLYIGANKIKVIPENISTLNSLEIFYMGGNRLEILPESIGDLNNLQVLSISDNKLKQLPNSILNLHKLRSLSLHGNLLSTLPPQIVGLPLESLSLRNNPLINRFVENLTWEPPSLKELTGRVIKTHKISYGVYDLPKSLIQYLSEANQCINPKCRGVYFTSRVEHVKFVDFCGKYRLPLMQYLCSPACTKDSPMVILNSDSESSDEEAPSSRMKKVLLG